MTRTIFMIVLFLLIFAAMVWQRIRDTVPKPRRLRKVTVKARWKDRHLVLNRQYVVKDEFKTIKHCTLGMRDPINHR